MVQTLPPISVIGNCVKSEIVGIGQTLTSDPPRPELLPVCQAIVQPPNKSGKKGELVMSIWKVTGIHSCASALGIIRSDNTVVSNKMYLRSI